MSPHKSPTCTNRLMMVYISVIRLTEYNSIALKQWGLVADVAPSRLKTQLKCCPTSEEWTHSTIPISPDGFIRSS
ncbi:hypothetical protein F0562_012305 [Nyssa sinensis]|uniref:Uncharacterized protein n=1 Tax=Nyssa sinensis TaxID=561372 RepID=A0A5J4ZW79_9ASTE|nr:hypothetical protein F0562_012305 [Nyssa sinensis]